MMYNNKLAVAIKNRGAVLKEIDDKVYLPYQSEYSIFIKNLHTTQVVVNIDIDGEDVLGGSGIIVAPFSNLNLERFVKNGNMLSGRKFRFIEKTDRISDYRGDKLEDGLVTITYQFEREQIKIREPFNTGPYWHQNHHGPLYVKSAYGGMTHDVNFTSAVGGATATINQLGSLSSTRSFNDKGITVEGSESNQEFHHATTGVLETQKHSIVIRLLGEDPRDCRVNTPITTKTKKVCPTCGKKSKHGADYCSKCGTFIS